MNIIASYINQNAMTESIKKTSNPQQEIKTNNPTFNKSKDKVYFSNEGKNLAESITLNKERAVSKAILNEVFKK